MARTSVICETPEVVRQLTESLKQSEDVGHIGRMKNGFGSTAVGRGGYRDIKVNLQPANFAHYVEVQVRRSRVVVFDMLGMAFQGGSLTAGLCGTSGVIPTPGLWVDAGCAVPVMTVASLSLAL